MQPVFCGGLQAIISRHNLLLTEELVRFLNALATDIAGRMYLLHPGTKTISLLQKIITDDAASPNESDIAPRRSGDATKDSTSHQYALAALQKLSWSKRGQNHMIDAGVLRWLTSWLQDLEVVRPVHRPPVFSEVYIVLWGVWMVNTFLNKIFVFQISEFSLEYGTALIMNLTLRSKGRDQCQDVTDEILPLLENLLECDNPQVALEFLCLLAHHNLIPQTS